MPAVQGIVSNNVPPNEQGEMQGMLTSLVSITAIIGPLVMTNLFYFFTKDNTPFYFPGSPFMLGAVLTGICLLIALKAIPRAMKHS